MGSEVLNSWDQGTMHLKNCHCNKYNTNLAGGM